MKAVSYNGHCSDTPSGPGHCVSTPNPTGPGHLLLKISFETKKEAGYMQLEKYFVVRVRSVATGVLEIKEENFELRYNKKINNFRIIELSGRVIGYQDKIVPDGYGKILVKNLKDVLKCDFGLFEGLNIVKKHYRLKPQLETWLYYRKKRF